MRRPIVVGTAFATLAFAGSVALAAGALQAPVVSHDPTEGKPITFTISGSTPGTDPNADYTAVLAVLPAQQGCGKYGYDDPALPGTEGYQTWDFANQAVSFTRSFTPGSPVGGSPDRFAAGTWVACDWLYDFDADANGDSNHGLIAASQTTFSVRKPHFRIVLKLDGSPKIQPYPPTTAAGVKFTTLTARITAEVWQDREMLVTIMPPGARTCPADVLDTPYWHRQVIIPHHSNEMGGINLRRPGPFTYKLGLALGTGSKAGRSLLCAGIYDAEDDAHLAAAEEAATHIWIHVRPLR